MALYLRTKFALNTYTGFVYLGCTVRCMATHSDLPHDVPNRAPYWYFVISRMSIQHYIRIAVVFGRHPTVLIEIKDWVDE